MMDTAISIGMMMFVSSVLAKVELWYSPRGSSGDGASLLSVLLSLKAEEVADVAEFIGATQRIDPP